MTYQIKQSYNDLIADIDNEGLYLTFGQKCELRRVYDAAAAALISAVENASGARPVDFVEKSRATIYYVDGGFYADLSIASYGKAGFEFANVAGAEWHDDAADNDWDDAGWYFHIYLD